MKIKQKQKVCFKVTKNFNKSVLSIDQRETTLKSQKSLGKNKSLNSQLSLSQKLQKKNALVVGTLKEQNQKEQTLQKNFLKVGSEEFYKLKITSLGPNNIGIDEFSYPYRIFIINEQDVKNEEINLFKIGDLVKAKIIRLKFNEKQSFHSLPNQTSNKFLVLPKEKEHQFSKSSYGRQPQTIKFAIAKALPLSGISSLTKSAAVDKNSKFTPFNQGKPINTESPSESKETPLSLSSSSSSLAKLGQEEKENNSKKVFLVNAMTNLLKTQNNEPARFDGKEKLFLNENLVKKNHTDQDIVITRIKKKYAFAKLSNKEKAEEIESKNNNPDFDYVDNKETNGTLFTNLVKINKKSEKSKTVNPFVAWSYSSLAKLGPQKPGSISSLTFSSNSAPLLFAKQNNTKKVEEQQKSDNSWNWKKAAFFNKTVFSLGKYSFLKKNQILKNNNQNNYWESLPLLSYLSSVQNSSSSVPSEAKADPYEFRDTFTNIKGKEEAINQKSPFKNYSSFLISEKQKNFKLASLSRKEKLVNPLNGDSSYGISTTIPNSQEQEYKNQFWSYIQKNSSAAIAQSVSSAKQGQNNQEMSSGFSKKLPVASFFSDAKSAKRPNQTEMSVTKLSQLNAITTNSPNSKSMTYVNGIGIDPIDKLLIDETTFSSTSDKINNFIGHLQEGNKLTLILPKKVKRYTCLPNHVVFKLGNTLIFVKLSLGALLGTRVKLKLTKVLMASLNTRSNLCPGPSPSSPKTDEELGVQSQGQPAETKEYTSDSSSVPSEAKKIQVAIAKIININPILFSKKQIIMKNSVYQMLKSGMHFGEKAVKCNPRMKKYVWFRKKGQNKNKPFIKKGRNVINLLKTQRCLNQALVFLGKYAVKERTFLFVGTKKPAAALITRASLFSKNAFFVNTRWLGGMLTNWKTILKSISKIRPILLEKQVIIKEILNKRQNLKKRLIEKTLLLRKKSKLLLKKGRGVLKRMNLAFSDDSASSSFSGNSLANLAKNYGSSSSASVGRIAKLRQEKENGQNKNSGQEEVVLASELSSEKTLKSSVSVGRTEEEQGLDQKKINEKQESLQEKNFRLLEKTEQLMKKTQKLLDVRQKLLKKKQNLKEQSSQLNKKSSVIINNNKTLLTRIVLNSKKITELKSLFIIATQLKSLKKQNLLTLNSSQFKKFKDFSTFSKNSKNNFILPNPPKEILNKIVLALRLITNEPTKTSVRLRQQDQNISDLKGVNKKEKVFIVSKLLSKFSFFAPYLQQCLFLKKQTLEKDMAQVKKYEKTLLFIKEKMTVFVNLKNLINLELSKIRKNVLKERQKLNFLKRKLKQLSSEIRLLKFLPKLRFLSALLFFSKTKSQSTIRIALTPSFSNTQKSEELGVPSVPQEQKVVLSSDATSVSYDSEGQRIEQKNDEAPNSVLVSKSNRLLSFSENELFSPNPNSSWLASLSNRSFSLRNKIYETVNILMKKIVDPKLKYPLHLIYDQKLSLKSKKVIAARKKTWYRLEKYFGGIANMTKMKKTKINKNVAIIIGQQEEQNAVRECKKLGIKMFHIVDTNCNPTLAQHFIPANDDSRNSIKYILTKILTRIRLAQKISFKIKRIKPYSLDFSASPRLLSNAPKNKK